MSIRVTFKVVSVFQYLQILYAYELQDMHCSDGCWFFKIREAKLSCKYGHQHTSMIIAPIMLTNFTVPS